MTSEKIIERLKAKNWYVICKTEHELALALNACHDAGLKWRSGHSACNFDFERFEHYVPFPISIGMICDQDTGVFWTDDSADWVFLCDDITDWLFNEINK